MVLFFLLHILFYIRHRLYYLFYLWQIKEFRIDRLKSEIRENRKIVFPKTTIIPLFLAGLSFFISLPNIIFALYSLIFFAYSKKKLFGYKKYLKKTKKVKALFYFSYFLVVLLYLTSFVFPLKIIYFFDSFFFFIVLISILPAKTLNYFLKNKKFSEARKKREEFSNLTVVGIAGSYGKTSTKEFLASLLEKKFNKNKILKTEKNQNTELAIANLIVSKLNKDHKFLIAEIGAYKVGEIKKVMEFLKPQFGILTGISFQHLDLFGSFENIKKAKSEIVYNLPDNGTAIFNGSNKEVLKIAKKYPKKKIIFSLEKTPYSNVWAEDIIQTKDYLEFYFSTEQKKEKIRLNLIGRHYIENFLAAAIMAKTLGLSLKEISQYANQIKPPFTSLKKIVLKNGLSVISDTYNMNFEGILSALNYLKLYKGKKIILLPCLIETGEKSKELHQKISQEINNICYKAYIFGKKCFIKDSKKFIYNPDLKEIKSLKDSLGKEDAILLEGKLDKKIIDIFK